MTITYRKVAMQRLKMNLTFSFNFQDASRLSLKAKKEKDSTLSQHLRISVATDVKVSYSINKALSSRQSIDQLKLGQY